MAAAETMTADLIRNPLDLIGIGKTASHYGKR